MATLGNAKLGRQQPAVQSRQGTAVTAHVYWLTCFIRLKETTALAQSCFEFNPKLAPDTMPGCNR